MWARQKGISEKEASMRDSRLGTDWVQEGEVNE